MLLMSFAKDYGADPLVIGNGSNLLVPDEGLDRLVIDTSADLNRVEPGEAGTPSWRTPVLRWPGRRISPASRG